ncbi:amidohydrolase 2 [Parvibaculum lavamentivorans DS-1]|uniref:Amidohydrolase 2 n=1 Tax=Parvibaculum lavamentivorans (strain DS-1 / DSM 13023 / NCIMB 13966) TaxID=402881 RepID=A7HUL4_PARL1|nr:amidohydrolase family protein [Parvibaculum lavamentivorans]ABS63597.1 amidohydrolase 2 [Parvibaculum lavamentivorans DS-1]
MAGNPEWLAEVKEAALEPELPIVDPHHHLWDHPGSRYQLDELMTDVAEGHNIRATVFVECKSMYRADGPDAMKPVGETEYVNGIAAQSASGQYGETRVAAGIVGFADLRLGAKVDAVLEAHMARAPERFRGIRHASAFDDSPDVRASHTLPPKGLLGLPEFREGFKRLAAYGLSFDAWLYHRQIPELTALARANPETPIIFDHFGGPIGIGPYEGKRAEIFAQWKKDVAELAACPNVVAKLGGINMAVNGFGWHKRAKPPTSDELVAATRDWYLHSIDVFGPERCMFESNFPVDKLSCSYGVLWNAFKKIAKDMSAGEKAALFHDTAARVYRLDI